MKIICMDGNGFFCKPDTALLRNDEPFYVPDFGDCVRWQKGRVVRIDRLAKCIEKRYAHRCYGEMGMAVEFVVQGVECESMARGFDRSFAVSPQFVPCAGDAEVDRSLAMVSQFVTLKIGDLLFVPTPGECGMAVQGGHITASLDGAVMLDFDIK